MEPILFLGHGLCGQVDAFGLKMIWHMHKVANVAQVEMEDRSWRQSIRNLLVFQNWKLIVFYRIFCILLFFGFQQQFLDKTTRFPSLYILVLSDAHVLDSLLQITNWDLQRWPLQIKSICILMKPCEMIVINIVILPAEVCCQPQFK